MHLYFAVIVILRMKALLAERRITSLQLRWPRAEPGHERLFGMGGYAAFIWPCC